MDNWDTEALSARLAHDASALSRQINLWSSWALEDLGEGKDVAPLLEKIRGHGEKLSAMIRLARQLSIIEMRRPEVEDLDLRDCVTLSLRSTGVAGALPVKGEGRLSADRVLLGTAIRLMSEAPMAAKGISLANEGLTFEYDPTEALDLAMQNLQEPGTGAGLLLNLPMVWRIMARQGGAASATEHPDGTVVVRLTFV